MEKRALHRATLSLLIVAMALAAVCAQAGATQLVNLPKYDIKLTLDPDTVGPGGRVHVTTHVVLFYYQAGKDPSVPDVYVDYEVKGPSGSVARPGGNTNGQGYSETDINMPSEPGQYTIVARAYDVAGGSASGQGEAYITVTSAAAVTITPSPPTASPVTTTPLAATPLPPTAVPPTAGPTAGGVSNMVYLVIGAVVLVLLILIIAAIAILAFFLLKKKPKPLPAPEKPAALPAAPEPGNKYCMHCGSPMAPDASKCPKCGLMPPSDLDTRACGKCGTILPAPAAKFCYNCGAEQEKAK